jgi:hypothetical protein
LVKCSGITQAGTACRGIPIDGSGFCYAHHPDREGERRRHGSKGGKRGGRGRPQVEVSNVKGQLQGLVADVLAGTVERADASVCGQLLNTCLKALDTELRITEQLQLVERMEALEASLESQNRLSRPYA